ncbi:uncharacterized protein LOC142335393 [Convolutriloba macropyga]|uniref:uncharacterized protein LOC142335393 n=1 Tax=Convolutriloba macropyga TaxID=536237 RepID=UPI003F52112A
MYFKFPIDFQQCSSGILVITKLPSITAKPSSNICPKTASKSKKQIMPRATESSEKRVVLLGDDSNNSQWQDDELQLMQNLKFEEGFCQWLPPAAFFLRKQQLLSQQANETHGHGSTSSNNPSSNNQQMSASNDTHGTAFAIKNRKETPKPYKFVHFRDNSNYIKHYREEHNSRAIKLHRKDIEMYNLLASDVSGFYDRLRRNKHGGATIINGQIYFRQDEIAAVSTSNNQEATTTATVTSRLPSEESDSRAMAVASVSHSIQTNKPSTSQVPLQRTRSIPHYKPRGYYQMPFFNITGKVLKMMPREFEDERFED